MRYIVTTFLLFVTTVSFAATGDTTIIHSHANANLASPPSNDDIWVAFPDNKTWSKIILKFELGCGTPNCSGWDYTVNTYLGKKTGLTDSAITQIDSVFSYSDTTWNYFQDSTIASIDNGVFPPDTTWSYFTDSTIAAIDSFYNITDTVWSYSPNVKYYQAGRLITPYGTYMASPQNGYNNQWKHPYYYDVTDYAGWLKDSVSVRIFYSGWSDAFSGKIDFILIEGEPTRTVLQVDELYNQYINYPDKTGFENVAAAKTVATPAGTTSAKLNLIMTGHGSQGEFDPRNFQIKVNGVQRYENLLWKNDCGWNAIAPQGGTWIFNRANWCPGEKVKMFEIDLSQWLTAGQNNTVDLDFEDYTVGSGEGAGYETAVYLVSYGSQKNNDAALEEIIAPNNDANYKRFNPVTTHPKVRIKNFGKNVLTQCDIAYWVKGGEKCYFQWHGNLTPFQSEVVTLPLFDWTGLDTADRVFYAEVSWANNATDEYTPNNLLYSSFDLPPVSDSSFILFIKTNNKPEENWYLLRNEQGDSLVFRNELSANTIYRDTTHLVPGSYVFDLYDYDTQNFWDNTGETGDGLNWWVNTQNSLETAGQFRFYKLNGTTNIPLYGGRYGSYNGDFGNNIHYEFTVGAPLGYGDPKVPCTPIVHSGIHEIETLKLEVYPNPTNEKFFVKADQSIGKPMLSLFNLQGQKVSEQSVYLLNGIATEVVLPVAVSTGVYFVEITNGTTRINRKLSIIK